MTAKKLKAYAMMGGAVLCAGGALLSFGYFLIVGPITALRVPLSNAGRLSWDILLSLSFFSVHSLLIRRTMRSRITRFIAEHYYSALFAIISGVSLFLVIFLWQPLEDSGVRLEGGLACLPRFVAGGVVLSFAFIIKSLRGFCRFDPFGCQLILDSLRGRRTRPAALFIRGPYRHVRHPLYTLMIVLLWSTPILTPDRILLNVLWTAWIIVGTFLEERDLLVEFGAEYHAYQRAAPRLVPWRLAKAKGRFFRLSEID